MLKQIFTWWHEATIGTSLMTRFRGEQVGSDEFGHKYYRDPKTNRRWVIFPGEVEASTVPPEWHAWLHRMVDSPPSETPVKTQSWEKPHLPNLTGTDDAYRPPGHIEKGGARAKATGDYEAWQPD